VSKLHLSLSELCPLIPGIMNRQAALTTNEFFELNDIPLHLIRIYQESEPIFIQSFFDFLLTFLIARIISPIFLGF
jgi:hypothetical protein